jgi:hypothetical protein
MTQYLAKVQGMPQQVELNKTIWEFIWEGERPPVNADILHLPIEQGGIKLLNLASRNKAIEIMWLRSYLTLGRKPPTWAYVADVLIGENITKDCGIVAKEAQMNVYLQSW